MSNLQGKVAVVTGGSSGIGLEAARRFVEAGAHVFITGRRQSELDKAKAVLGDKVTAVQGDVASLDDLDRLYQAVRDQKASIDVLVINAGIVEMATLAEATPAHFDRIFNVNARGAFFTAQKALPLLNDGGSIVLVASTAQLIGFPAYTVYSGTKAAMRSFTRSWAAELAPRGIRVNTVSPGATDTPIFDTQASSKQEAAALKAQFAEMIPLRRIGLAEEVAAAIYFLASSEGGFTNGIDLVVDGGHTQI